MRFSRREGFDYLRYRYYLCVLYYLCAGQGTMSTSKVTSKGQATIPADVRARLGIKPGDSVEFTVNDAGEMVVRRAPRLSDLTGMIKVDPKVAAELAGRSWDDIRTRTWDEVIAERHRDRD